MAGSRLTGNSHRQGCGTWSLHPRQSRARNKPLLVVDVLHHSGAGISGIDAAYHLQRECPEKRFALLENQASFGGTWITHEFPGIRSDSDLYTYGYSWKPWSGAPIATAEEILTYLDEVLDEQSIRQHIHFHHDVKCARWSSEDKCWTLEVERKDTGEKLPFACNFLWMCQGYYRHSEGYTPCFPGVERFRGRIVHPQSWPQHLEYNGKTVLVIGSGATAATLVPAMAEHTAHITTTAAFANLLFPGGEPYRDCRYAADAWMSPKNGFTKSPAARSSRIKKPPSIDPSTIRRR